MPLVIPVLIAWTAKLLRSNIPRPLARIVLGSWLILAVVLVTIRSGKVVAWLVSYDERNPQPLHDFVSSHVPGNSRVFGPEDYYFYAVEAAGSHYLFMRPRITSGLVSKLDHDLDWRKQLNDGQPVYLIWPKDDPLPHDLVSANLFLEATFAAKLERNPQGGERQGGVPVIHPQTCIGLLMVRHLIRILKSNHPAATERSGKYNCTQWT